MAGAGVESRTRTCWRYGKLYAATTCVMITVVVLHKMEQQAAEKAAVTSLKQPVTPGDVGGDARYSAQQQARPMAQGEQLTTDSSVMVAITAADADDAGRPAPAVGYNTASIAPVFNTTMHVGDNNSTALGAEARAAVAKAQAQMDGINVGRQYVQTDGSYALVSAQNNGGENINIHAAFTRRHALPALDAYWSRVLHFVPTQDNADCRRLFTTPTSDQLNLTPAYTSAYTTYREQLTRYNVPREHLAPQHHKLSLTYQTLAQREGVKTVCEIGFNLGQSALVWLTAKSDIKLYSFDISVSRHTEQMGRAVRRMFPSRFRLIAGDSTRTVPRWLAARPPGGVKCDIVSVDGGHRYPVVHADLLNMKKAAAHNHVLVADDIYYPGVHFAWRELVKTNVIKPLFDCWIHGEDIDFAIGHYNL